MIDKIQAFGDSFLYGSELSDCDGESRFSSKTWPALIADKLGLKYDCQAEGKSGNSKIAFEVIGYADPNALVVINWSWIDRDIYFDVSGTKPCWVQMMSPHDEDEVSKFYYRNMHSELGGKYFSLVNIFSAHSYLKKKNIPFISTYMDKIITDSSWSNSPFVVHLQEQVTDELRTFPGDQTFLEWSRANNYAEGQGWHPLEEAHEEAAEIWRPIYEQAINTHIT